MSGSVGSCDMADGLQPETRRPNIGQAIRTADRGRTRAGNRFAA